MRTIIIIGSMLVILRATLYLTSLIYYSTPRLLYVKEEKDISTYEAEKRGYKTGIVSENNEDYELEHYMKIEKKILRWREGLRIKEKVDTVNIGFWNRKKRI